MRIAPSSRTVSPLSSGFSQMKRTRDPYSSGRPRRGGKGTWRARLSRTSCDTVASIGVSKVPGAIVATRMPVRASSRAAGRVRAATPPFEAA